MPSNASAPVPTVPVVQTGPPESAPALPLPDASAAVVPLPSSSGQCATGPPEAGVHAPDWQVPPGHVLVSSLGWMHVPEPLQKSSVQAFASAVQPLARVPLVVFVQVPLEQNSHTPSPQ